MKKTSILLFAFCITLSAYVIAGIPTVVYANNSAAYISDISLPAGSLVAPVATAGSGATETQITANWNTSVDALHYHLDVSTSIGFGSFVTGFNNLDVNTATSYNVTGLSCGTTYYYRVRADNTCNTSSNSNIITYASAVNACNCLNTITDSRDSKTYNIIAIGTQCWMKENLKATVYKNSVAIPQITDNTLWAADATGAYSCFNNDCTTNGATYGMLYNLNAVTNANGICPTG
ncbi:MAG: hypothetical protein HGB12_09315, partial [Bacteroidetes bacterium]|nr:hypothetical protein [Bacteroidota bacterium]